MTSRATRFPSAETLAAQLPTDFALGVATSAFQIEGATREGGRGASTWDVFTHQPGRIRGGATADVAADHIHRLGDDLDLVRDLGADAYRFSISWPRVQPGGSGRLNERGIAFYDQLLDRLLADGISPMATLFHWDTPLELPGGWRSRDTAQRLGELAFLLGERFGDRVDRWVTVNEPATVMLNGYALGIHAPGETLLFDALPVAHNLLLGHAYALEGLRGADVRGGVGITNVHTPTTPATSSDDDTAFAWLFDVLHNRIFADPVLLGQYPEPVDDFAAALKPLIEVDSRDLALISQPIDFYGLNYYFPTRIAAGAGRAVSPDGDSEAMASLPFHLAPWPEFATTGFGWPVAPEFLETTLAELAQRYGAALPPVFITEGGASFPESLVLDERSGERVVADPRRIDYLARHLEAALTATAPGGVAESVDLRGYFVWTLLDNFEWAAGYSQRFGLVHVDFATQERTPKDSFRWMQALAGDRRR
ncbi:beta-glucosidase [Agreia bicolorata]|uniref:Beta-glucosidase n=1 Tax=Agreia bicolorata TaxID=110935 RepID=A0A1T4YCX1_9MICO|nr:family 1 glycosylhydrolase [Agreia bicolorata]SKA99560.1 beta-glucosidase [Agreia bicolorata]